MSDNDDVTMPCPDDYREWADDEAMTDRPAVDLAALRAEHRPGRFGHCDGRFCQEPWPCPTVVLLENYAEAVGALEAQANGDYCRNATAALASLDAKGPEGGTVSDYACTGCDVTGESRESVMPVVTPGVWCDPCLVPLVTALNEGGFPTAASCCGHGQRPASVILVDDRFVVVMSRAEFENFDGR